MIYKGKEYKEVTDETTLKGDLMHVTALRNEVCDIWCFTADDWYTLPHTNVVLTGDRSYLSLAHDKYTRYRYVKDNEQADTNDRFTALMVELEHLVSNKKDYQKLLDSRIQEIKEEQEELKQKDDQLSKLRAVLETM